MTSNQPSSWVAKFKTSLDPLTPKASAPSMPHLTQHSKVPLG